VAIADAIEQHATDGSTEGDYPTVEDGARGVRFIETTVASAASAAKWTPYPSAKV
jgi:hypothetical protein